MIQPDASMPDDLIRSRNWNGLTAGEKESLKDVAATEEEFRLLKLMLSEAVTMHDDVPQISPAVHQRLKAAFPKNEQRKAVGWWRYAAAAAILLAIAGTVWIVRKKDKAETPIAREENKLPRQTIVPNTGKNIPPVQQQVKPQAPIQKDTIAAPAPEPRQTKKVTPPPQKVNPVDPGKIIPPVAPEPAIAINTSLKDNAELLNLVTEVY